MFKIISHPSFIGPFNVAGPRHLPTMPMPQPGPAGRELANSSRWQLANPDSSGKWSLKWS